MCLDSCVIYRIDVFTYTYELHLIFAVYTSCINNQLSYCIDKIYLYIHLSDISINVLRNIILFAGLVVRDKLYWPICPYKSTIHLTYYHFNLECISVYDIYI